MKFIIFILASLCFTQTLAEAANKEKLQQLGNCKTYTVDKGIVTGCTTCHTGFKKVNENCVYDTSSSAVKYPAYSCQTNGRCEFNEIKYNSANDQCGNKVDLVQENGDAFPKELEDITNPTCVACATFKANNQCEMCATGYILNGEKCIPLKTFEQENGTELFGQGNPTNEHCVHGYNDASGKHCEACSDVYFVSDGACKKVETTIEGCVMMYLNGVNELICTQCREGYVLKNSKCEKIPINLCLETTTDPTTNDVICTKCMFGYYPNGDECAICPIDTTKRTSPHFTGDECNLLSVGRCEKCNQNCKYDTTKQICVSRHCDLFDSSNVCLKCQQGYVLDQSKNCIASSDCRDITTKVCKDGYYESNEGSEKVCKKCKGKCTKCLSDEICLEGEKVSSGHALNGLPCFDPNCKLCSSEDPHVCLECKPSVQGEDEIVLKNGRCYLKYHSGYITGSVNPYNACRFYKEPAFSSDSSVTITGEMLNNVYIRQHSVAYTHSLNTDQLCEHHDMVPYYFQHDGDTITCAGKNRDPHTDCECIEGYYAEDIHKFTNCKKFSDPYCEKPLNKDICAKCKDGLKIIVLGEGRDIHYECGCDEGSRPDENGICVPCSKNCRTCRTDTDGKEECLSCNGYVTESIEYYKSNNYFRDLANLCECKANYAAYDAGDGRVYPCHPIPAECPQPEDHIVTEKMVKCNNCPGKVGFNPNDDCKTCLEGYREVKDGDEITKCIQCPLINETDITGCSSCGLDNDGNVTCSSCIEYNLDPEKNCQECKPGATLKFREGTNGKPTPLCVVCPKYCNQTEGCYYGTDPTKGEFENPYTDADVEGDNVEKYCVKCNDENGNTTLHCKCSDGSLLVDGHCETCGNLFVNYTSSVKGCDLTKGCVGKILEEEIVAPFTCTNCKSLYSKRLPSTNCTKCELGYYPAEPQNGNGGCDPCPEYCMRCDTKDKCDVCRQVSGTSDLIKGTDCLSCRDGYFTDGSKVKDNVEVEKGVYKQYSLLKCTKCATNCKACERNALNCSVCTDSLHIPSKDNGCAQCIPGYYYNPFDGSCQKVKNDLGFTDSVFVCPDDNGKLVECATLYPEPVIPEDADEEDKEEIYAYYNATERAIRCDTTIPGVAPEPVEGLCVCKTGFHDNRTAEEIAASPKPVCLDDRLLTGDDFCVDAIENNDGTYACNKCNADYLEVKNGKCVCKNSHYTTSWGACIPCGRHNKGCKECSGKKQCTKCEDGYSLRDGACHAK